MNADEFQDASARLRKATPREVEVLDLILAGRKNREIAAALGISVRAVEDRRFRLMKKLQVDSLAELVGVALRARMHVAGLSAGALATSAAGARQWVEGIEVWTADGGSANWTFSAGTYRSAPSNAADPQLPFGRNDRLAESIRVRRTCMLRRDLQPSPFIHSGATETRAILTTIGIPVFCSGQVRAVVLLFIHNHNQLRAALEHWKYDPARHALSLDGGTWSNCERLRRLSEFLALPPGQGLPGIAAEQRIPFLASGFADDAKSVRGVVLAAEQLTVGIALPLTDSGADVPDVFLLFQEDVSPLFAVLQVWKPSPDETDLQLTAEILDGVPSLATQTAGVSRRASNGIAEIAWKNGIPTVTGETRGTELVSASSASASVGLGIAIPCFVDGRVVAVTVLGD